MTSPCSWFPGSRPRRRGHGRSSRSEPSAGHDLTPTITPTTWRHALDDATAGLLRDALHEHSVLFFHDQDLSEDEQLAFASTFGTVGQYPLTKMLGGTALPSTIEDTADSPPDADGWHTDVTWVAEPPACVPERPGHLMSGGDTMRASLFAAYDTGRPSCSSCAAAAVRHHRARTWERVTSRGRDGRSHRGRVPAGRAPLVRTASRHRSARFRRWWLHGRSSDNATRATPARLLRRYVRTPTSAQAGGGRPVTLRSGTRQHSAPPVRPIRRTADAPLHRRRQPSVLHPKSTD